MTIDLKALSAPFPVNEIEWRVGSTNKEKTSGIGLAYIDARMVMERLDAVCGVGGWKNEHPHANGKTSCRISIKIGDEWVHKENGAGDSDFEAEKGAFSDSFKRAAVLWGIGRYLYNMPNIWVELDDRKQITATGKAKLIKALNELMINTFGSAQDKKAAASMGMKYDEEQNKQAWDYALKFINSSDTQDKIDTFLKKNDGKLKNLPKELYDDVLLAASTKKTDILSQLNGGTH